MKQNINILWFKRDLRLRDHAPLQAAIESSLPTLLCFFFEPSVMNYPQSSDRHWRFIYESVQDLNAQLEKYQIQLYAFHSEVMPVFEALTEQYEIVQLFSHQETGLKVTFDRDKTVKRFCKKHQINWQEFGQDSIQRGIKDRRGWNTKMNKHLAEPLIKSDINQLNALQLPSDWYQKHQGEPLKQALTIPNDNFQKGGETMAWRYMNSFFKHRYPNYFRHISKPLDSRRSCSRLSPYLAFGNLSCRQVYQYAEWIIQNSPPQKRHPLKQFQSRVWWRSHFIQKLETEYQIEFRAINPGLDTIPRVYDEKLFNAWATGQTGFPMIDACMRCLQQTGYINFRMRAMLVSFVTFLLWQDWKKASVHLAQLFLDFEPGIHYAQFQMQAGLTGYNTLRIYNPTFQIEKHDKKGEFIKQWIPELRDVPVANIREPWKMTEMEQTFYNCKIGVDYPAPVVQFETAAKKSKDTYWAYKKSAITRANLPRVLKLHCIPKEEQKYGSESNSIKTD